MTVFKPKLRINRRNFVSGAVTLGTSTVLHPFASLAETDQLRILWSGVTFMGRRGREEYLQETFPNIFPLLEIPENRTKLYKVIGKLPGSEDGRVNVNNGEILWVSKRKGAFGRRGYRPGETDLGMVVGITSDRNIANFYDASQGVTYLIYEVQTYVILYDNDTSQITQSFPIRMLAPTFVRGRVNSETVRNKMWGDLSGERTGEDRGREGSFPEYFSRRIQGIKFRRAEKFSVRVTNVKLAKYANDWLARHDKPLNEFIEISQHSLTSAVSEQCRISIQPPYINKGMAKIVMAIRYAEAIKGGTTSKKLTLKEADLELQLVMGGMSLKLKKVKGMQTIYDRRTVTGVRLNVFLRGEQIFGYWLRGISVERTDGTWNNDYYNVLDLNQRLFDWFFAELYKGTGYGKMVRGHTHVGRNKKHLTRVINKGGYEEFVNNMQNLRKILLKA